MELSTELVAILATISLGWAGWISVTTIRNQTAISKAQASEEVLHNDMKDLSTTMKESFADVKDQINKVNTRLDTFLSNEIAVLKDLAKK